MMVSFAVYTLGWSWPFALGLVLLILVHEFGHVIAAKRVGLQVGAPIFVPFLGAFVALKESPKNAWIESQVGIGGPLLGTVGAFVCHLVYVNTGHRLYEQLAFWGFTLNLFNLAPIGKLDGGRIVTAVSPWLWLIGTAIVTGMLFTHFNPILLVILGASMPRLFSLFRPRTEKEQQYYDIPASQRIFMGILYFVLIAYLAVAMNLTEGRGRH